MTIREIAALAGVSPASVSLVINNRKGVSEETRRKVMAIINENGYSPAGKKRKAHHARMMVIKFHTHGATEENQGFIASIIDRIESECRRHAFELVMARCGADNAADTLRALMHDPPDGVILIGSEMTPEHYPLLDLITAPTVVLDNNLHYGRVDSVVMANETIAAAAVDYLYALGHRDIGYLKYGLPVRNCQERYRGYVERMRELDLPIPDPCLLAPTLNTAYETMKEAIRDGRFKPHTAFVADNDSVAIGALKALIEAGYRVPEDFSVIGVDDIPFSAVSTPALTTMRISRSTLGSLAVQVLRTRIKNPSWPAMHLQIDGQLIERNSCRGIKG